MDSITITRIVPSGLDTLVRLSRKIFHESFYHQNKPENMQVYMDRAFHPEQLRNELENQLSEFYFLWVGGKIAGYLKLNQAGAQSDLHDPDSLEIERIYVDTGFQGKGLGARLIAKAKERAGELNLHSLWLGVWEKNTEAIRFYERHGFIIFGSHPFVFGDEVQTDMLMKWER